MDLSEVIDENIIDLDVKGTTKDEVLRELSQRLYDNGYISDVEQFVKDIYVRESMGITGAGNHIAIPHGKSSAVNKITIAVGRFLVCVSDDEGFAQNHMRLLAELAGKIGKDSLAEELQNAKTPAEVVKILTA